MTRDKNSETHKLTLAFKSDSISCSFCWSVFSVVDFSSKTASNFELFASDSWSWPLTSLIRLWRLSVLLEFSEAWLWSVDSSEEIFSSRQFYNSTQQQRVNKKVCTHISLFHGHRQYTTTWVNIKVHTHISLFHEHRQYTKKKKKERVNKKVCTHIFLFHLIN